MNCSLPSVVVNQSRIRCLSWSSRIWSTGSRWSVDYCVSCVIYTNTDKSTTLFTFSVSWDLT